VAETTKNYTRQRQLTVKQQNAIDMLILGSTDNEAATAVKVNRVTVTKWRNYDPVFAAELNRRRKELWGASVDRLRALIPKALDALEVELASGKHRVKAALDILRICNLGEKNPILERYLVGPTTPEDFIDARVRGRRPDPLREMVDGEPIREEERAAVLADLDAQLADSTRSN
jgi:hypothetical protein